ncbi:MAG: outer membrane protein assembly factor [Xanthomonadales bacterium]|nr:outer membrane protein assembly factor [Xanthomonadales bacterium]
MRTLLCLILLLPGLAFGQILGKVRLKGIEGEMADNVRKSVSVMNLSDADRAALSEARLAYLLRKAPAEVVRALEPFGYYESQVQSQVTRTDGKADVVLEVAAGDPVTVAELRLAINGAASDDERIAAAVDGFHPRQGERLEHARYEDGKSAIQHALLARGYFDAQLDVHRVEVSRAQHRADIDLAWTSGVRYRFGETRFEGSHVRESLLEKTVPYQRGEPYEQDQLLALQQRLTALDYFGVIDVRPDTEQAEGEEVPIVISLQPGKRTVYTAGLSFGTDSGAGIQLGMERRWVNDRGHKFSTQLDWAQRRKSLGAQYRIPAFAWSEGWYSLGANRRDEESDVLKTRITELVASRSGAWNGWTLAVGAHLRNEEFELGSEQDRRDGRALRGRTRLIYPELSAQRVVSDDPMYPSRGFSLRGEFKIGAQALGSDVSFAQVLVEAKLIRSFGERNRMLLRGQLGRTVTNSFSRLPPSLRFFAGGDRSIRGYGYQEVGPRVGELPIGGKNLLVGSAEFERMFTATWGAAAFVDAGNAFNEINGGAAMGAGLGLRWRSPVGMVRVDLAHGFDEAASRFQIHLNIGPDL